VTVGEGRGKIVGMTSSEAMALLKKLQAGEIGPDAVLRAFQAPPVAKLGFACVDTHRALRKGFPEVIYGEGKTPEHAKAVRKKLKQAVHHPVARCITIEKSPLRKRPGIIAVLAAGTSDLPVAEEAAITADIMGNRVERIYDVGVAGLHRLLSRLETIQTAHVVIAVAGMEGALPGVVAGLISQPVIAVPTSVGYGANLGGLTALFGMLSSCSSGLTVVNIDNGFGAGYAASQINVLADTSRPFGPRKATRRFDTNGRAERT
jgi:NCAIR mutase (PurE)-related protein